MRKLYWLIAFVSAVTSALAEVSVTGVSAQQRYPWNGMVDVAFTITGESGVKYDTSFVARDVAGGTNLTMKTVYKSDGSAAVLTNQLAAGSYKWVWNAAADLPDGFECGRVKVDVNVNAHQGLYMVIDLSAGSSATSYSVSYLDAVPSGGWTDEYKTSKLVLRRIDAGTFMMCGTIKTTISKPFYIGVFEITQGQHKNITGRTSWYPFEYGDSWPAHGMTYDSVRGTSNGSKWPITKDVDDSSFLGILRKRTNVLFDLPTEAQWEYASRAGTTSLVNNGGSEESDLLLVGQCTPRGGGCWATKSVGSFLPNNWGLYDMHGNLWEICLDWWGDLIGGVDPIGPSEGMVGGYSARVCRGGSWDRYWEECVNSYRFYVQPSGCNSDEDGLRICVGCE